MLRAIADTGRLRQVLEVVDPDPVAATTEQVGWLWDHRDELTHLSSPPNPATSGQSPGGCRATKPLVERGSDVQREPVSFRALVS
jgi:hypothetical protein